MASRFQQLMVSDSDEDSTDKAVIDRREERSNGVPSSRATPPPAGTPTQPTPTMPPTKAADSGLASVRTGTPRNDSMASSRRILLGPNARTGPQAAVPQSGSPDTATIDFNVDQTPNSKPVATAAAQDAVPLSHSQHSLTFDTNADSAARSVGGGSALAVPVPTRASGWSARHSPETRPLLGATAPRETASSIDSTAVNGPAQRTSSQRARTSAGQGTPRQSDAGSVGSDDQKRKTKVVRRKVVRRRRKDADPNAPSGVLRVDEEVIRPGRPDGAAATTISQAHVPPPPSRVSPRAMHAAVSRSTSRANSPAESLRTPGGGPRIIPPQIPTSRVNSRAVTPRTPRVGHVDGVPPLSVRSQCTDANPGSPLIPPRSGHHSSRHTTPRTPVGSATHDVDSTIGFEVAPCTATSNTVNFNVEDSVGRTDDTISFEFDETSTPQRPAHHSADYLHRHPQIPSPSALDDGPTPMTTDKNGQKVMLHRAKVRLTETADGRRAWMLFSPRMGEGTAAPLQEIPAPPKRLSQRAQDILAAKRRAVEEEVKKRHAGAVKRTAALESVKSPVFFKVEDEGTEQSAATATESELHFESAPLSDNKHISEKQRRPTEPARSARRLSIARRTRVHFAFPSPAFYSETATLRHAKEAQAAGEVAWTRHTYDTMSSCAGVLRASSVPGGRNQAERVVRALLPVQVAQKDVTTATTGSEGCGCVVYDHSRDDALRQLISNNSTREEGVRRYLNLQPMQLANVEMQNMVDPPLESPAESPGNVSEANQRPMGCEAQRGVATLGGLWCTAEALRDGGRPTARKDAVAPRRILRICGGQALDVPLLSEHGATLDVRCYELLLFPRESLSPSAVNYGSEGLTLGQLIAPPASSFPLTPRIIDDPVVLKEYKKRLLSTKNRQITIVNNEDDRDTFADATHPGKSSQYLTLTMVTISSRRKYTIELTLVLLPFRSSGICGGKTVAEVPRFCSATVMTYRRLQGLALSFSTKSAFMSAYKALLWATECDIVDVQPGEGEDAAGTGIGYSKLRVCATTSPMVPWVSSFGRISPDQKREETYHGNCLDFAVLTLAAPPEAIQKTEPEPREPLTLEDFVIVDGDGDGEDADDGARSEQSGATGRQQRRSSIFTSTLIHTKKLDGSDNENANAPNADTVVGLTPYGVIRRAVNQKTSEVFDVRVMPRNRGRMAPTWDAAADAEWSEAGGQTVKAKQEHLLQQDVEAAIMMEYTSRLPFHSRVYGVLVDEQRYYIFQEPWISALALEQSANGSAERDAIAYNVKLKSMTQSTAVMSLKDFIHAILRPDDNAREVREEVKLQIAHVLVAQLLLLITSLHGKGMLLGPCPPQRILVRIENAVKDGENEEEQESIVDTPDKTRKEMPVPPKVQSSNIQLFVPDLGVNTLAWGYERQQCGVLEYLPPLYVLEQMLSESIGKEERAWTTHDDWWTYLTLCFELFASDGSALVTPKKATPVPTPTPTLTKFLSPVDILDVWQEVVTDSSVGVAGTAAETVGHRVRRYVHQRVLKSVSRSLDSWIVTKAEEVEFFGTTAARRRRRVVRAVPPQSGTHGCTIGVSLAAAYLQSARETSATSSIAFQTEDGEGGEEEAENVLEDMPWVFQLRDFFDAVLDAVFARCSCSVHSPALCLVSHPFFRTVSLPHIFDGTHVFSPVVSDFALRQLTKPKVQAALLAYRTRAHRGTMALRPETPLMITGSAYNVAGGAPLLPLSSPAYQGELTAATTARENNLDSGNAAKVDPAEGLVFSRTNSMSQGLNGMGSPRAQSPAAAPWSQQKLRAMYNPTEWQSIAALETEVRGALYTFGPRESVSSRRASANQDYASNPATISSGPPQAEHHERVAAHAETASVASSGHHRDPRVYEQVFDAAPDTRPARGAARGHQRHPRSNVVSAGTPVDAYDSTATDAALGADDAQPFAQASPQEMYNSHPTYWRDGRQPGVGDAGQHSSRYNEQSRRNRGLGDTRDMVQSLNDLANRHTAMRQNHVSRRHHRRDGDDGNSSSDCGTGYREPHPQQQQQQSSRPSSRQSNRQTDSRPSSRHRSRHQEASRHHAWPDQFLDSATLQKKGQPQRLADPQSAAADRLTIDVQTQRSSRSVGSHSHHGVGVVQGSKNMRVFHESSSEESYVLVASDDEVNTDHGHGSAHPSIRMSRESPVPRNPRGSHTTEVASARENYFEF